MHGRRRMQIWCAVLAVQGIGHGRRQKLSIVDVGEAESYSRAPCMVHQSARRNRVGMNITGSSKDESIIDLTSIGTPDSDREE